MLIHLGCLREGVGEVLEGRVGEVSSRNGDSEQPSCCLFPAQRCSHSRGDMGGDGTRTPEPAAAMPELTGRSRVGAGGIPAGDWAWGLVKLRLGCPVVW